MIFSGTSERMEEGFLDGDGQMRYNRYICDTGGCKMPISLRIPPKKEEMIKRAARKEGRRRPPSYWMRSMRNWASRRTVKNASGKRRAG
jgi:hypothetical protein